MKAKHDARIQPPDKSQKLVLLLVAAGLAVIVLTSIYHRFNSSGLIKQTGLPMTSETTSIPPINPEQIPAEIPQAMLDALAQQGMSLADLGMNATPGGSETGDDGAASGSAMSGAVQPVQDGEDLATLLNLAEMYTSIGDLSNAQTFVHRALVSAPTDPRPYYQQGKIYQIQNNFPLAAEIMERSLNLGDSAQVRHDLAQIYASELNDRAKAIEHLNAAIAMPDLGSELRLHYQAELQELSSQ